MLNIDQFFYHALRSNADIIEVTDGRIFNTGRSEVDETEDRIPYIIITFDGASADTYGKDDRCAELSTATVSVLCVGDEREDLAELTEMVHDTIRQAMEETDFYEHDGWSFVIESCTPTASAVQMDEMKPCYYQTLTYNCDTYRK